jgi:SAM-dependent methyltransferase
VPAVAAEDWLRYLDENVFAPFLGTCDVMLEIGAGGGRFTEILVPRCRRLIAADTSKGMLKLLRRRFADERRVEPLLLDGRGLATIADASVDAAFSYDVFVHLHHWDFVNYLLELRRVLRPGGKAVIQHANTFTELGWPKFCEGLVYSAGRHQHPGAFTLMTPELMRELCRRADLEVVDCRTDVVPRDAISLLQAR